VDFRNNSNMRVLAIVLLAGLAFANASDLTQLSIVGGTTAADGAWPWQLSQRNGASHSCGASLIRATWALSAAHCVGGAVNLYTLIAGTNQRSCPGGNCQQRPANLVTRHADFENSGVRGYPNDIAVIRWGTAIQPVNGKIQYATLATTTNQVGRTCFITGWGRLTGGGAIPEDLQQAAIDVLTRDECLEHWGAIQVSDSQVCVYDKATQARGACNGDSGGPLVCQVSAGVWELVGATSWGRSGCATTSPSVYTRVSAYNAWILNAIGE
jgi:secreted trypsin-like serine protease